VETLVHIGWPKTATTWLQEKVFSERHGYAQPLSREEIIRQFVLPDQLAFDPEELRRSLERRTRELSRGLVPVITHERLCGALHNRLESVVIGERVVSCVPEAKILIVVREQRSAMLAAWQQYVRSGGSPESGPAVRSLKDYFGDQAMRRSVLPPPGYLGYFEYDRLVAWYQRQVGVSRVLVLSLELLRRHPGQFLALVHEFSGTPSAELPDPIASNGAWAPSSYVLKRWLNYLGDRSHYTRSRRTRYQAVMSAVYQFDDHLPSPLRSVGAPSMRRSVEMMAASHFVPSNRRLRELVPWDPEEFGYMT
jgi:hypothetical protein